MTRTTQPPGKPTTAADVADVYLRALQELTKTVVEQGELTRAAVADCTQHVLALSARVDALENMQAKETAARDELESRIHRIESELGIAANG